MSMANKGPWLAGLLLLAVEIDHGFVAVRDGSDGVSVEDEDARRVAPVDGGDSEVAARPKPVSRPTPSAAPSAASGAAPRQPTLF